MTHLLRTVLLLGSFVCFIGAVSASDAKRVRVLVAVPPYVEIARSLGGEAVEVHSLLEAGESHESFAPTPSRVLGWRADLYWSVGMDFESLWVPKLRTLSPGMVVTEPPMDPVSDHDSHDESVEHADAHTWLDPHSMRVQAREFVAHLIALKPGRQAEFEANLAAFEMRSLAIEASLRERLSPYRGERFYVYHGAFDHFAEAFGLEQVALQRGQRPPSLRELAMLIEQAQADGATAVFVQPQESAAAARKLAHAVGAKIIALDPLATAWDDNLQAIGAALESDFVQRSSRK